MGQLAAIPAGASRGEVLSAFGPLIGEFNGRCKGASGVSSLEFTGNSANTPELTVSDLGSYNPAGIAGQLAGLTT